MPSLPVDQERPGAGHLGHLLRPLVYSGPEAHEEAEQYGPAAAVCQNHPDPHLDRQLMYKQN